MLLRIKFGGFYTEKQLEFTEGQFLDRHEEHILKERVYSIYSKQIALLYIGWLYSSISGSFLKQT